MGKISAFLGSVFAILVILFAIAMFIIIVPLSLWFIYTNWQQFDPNTIAAIFTGLIVIFGYYQTKKREIAARHFTEKKIAYMGFIEVLVKVLKGQKDGTPFPQEILVEAMYSFRGEMIVWGGTDTINAFDKYIENAELGDAAGEFDTLLAVDDLLRAMRKELGHSDFRLKKGRIVGILLDQAGKEQLKEATK